MALFLYPSTLGLNELDFIILVTVLLHDALVVLVRVIIFNVLSLTLLNLERCLSSSNGAYFNCDAEEVSDTSLKIFNDVLSGTDLFSKKINEQCDWFKQTTLTNNPFN